MNIWTSGSSKKLQATFSSNYKNKKLQYYDSWKNFLDQQERNDLRTYDNIRKITNGQGDGYTTRFLLDYPYFKEYYMLIA